MLEPERARVQVHEAVTKAVLGSPPVVAAALGKVDQRRPVLDDRAVRPVDSPPVEHRAEVFGDRDHAVGLAQQTALERLEGGADLPTEAAGPLLGLGDHGDAVEILQPEHPGHARPPAPAGHDRLGDEGHVAGEDHIGAESGGDTREPAPVAGLLADPAHRRVAGERLACGHGHHRQVRLVAGVEPALPAGVRVAVHVLDGVSTPSQGAAEIDLERVAGEVVDQHAPRPPGSLEALWSVDQPHPGACLDASTSADGAVAWIVVPHRRVPSPNVLPHRAPPTRRKGCPHRTEAPAPSRLTTTQVTEE